MKVPFCVLFLEFFLSAPHALTIDSSSVSETSETPFSDNDSTDVSVVTTPISTLDVTDLNGENNPDYSQWKISITNITPTAKSIFIEWDELPSGTSHSYQVSITEINSGHYAPKCDRKNTTIKVPNIQKTFYNFTTASPDYNYSIVISTNIEENRISSDVQYVTTFAAAPDEPRNVVVKKFTGDDGESMNISKILTWDMPCHPNGQIKKFQIELKGIYTPNNTKSHHPNKVNYEVKAPKRESFSQTLIGLWASTNYTLTIRAVGRNGVSGPAVKKTFLTRDAIPAAPKVSLKSKGSSYIDVEWQPSDDQLYGRIISYNLDIVSVGLVDGPSDSPAQKHTKVVLDGDTTNYNYTNAKSYWKYAIYVKASTSQGTGPNGNLPVSTNASEPGAPVFDENEFTITNSSVTIVWGPPVENTGKIIYYKIGVTPVKPLYDIPSGCPVISSNPVNETIDGSRWEFSALPYYKYKIEVAAATEAGFGAFGIINVNTSSGVPDEPRNVVVKNHTEDDGKSTSISKILTWDMPCHPNGEIERFEIELDGTYTPNNTKKHHPDTVNYEVKGPKRESFSQTLNGLWASTNYTLIIRAVGKNGVTGPGIKNTFLTRDAIPGEPRNVLVENHTEDDGKSRNISKILTWDMPYHPNGEIERFEIELLGIYTPNNTKSHHPDKVNYEVKPPKRDSFNQTLIGLWASTNYTLTIRAVGRNGVSGPAVEKTFLTRDAIPAAPKISLISKGSSYIKFQWPPSDDQLYGRIIGYNLSIIPVEPASYPRDCPAQELTEIVLDGDTTNYSYTNAKSYWKYVIYVSANTSQGTGPSGSLLITTNASTPETVRSVDFSLSSVTQEKYNSQVSINFKRPCFTNGPSLNINIDYHGTRTFFEKISYNEPITFSDETDLEYKFDLKPEYFYKVNITTDNGEFSNSYGFSFSAPSGVPPMISLEAIEFSDARLSGIDVTLKKERFDYINGEIRYISLILSEIPQNGNFAAWDGNTWPRVFENNVFQLTEDFWTPFEGADVATFSIGSKPPGCPKSMQYCNEPLKDDKEYFLIVRTLTNEFYRDSPAIRFRTAKSWTGFICGVLFGVLLAGILAIVAFFLWRKGVFKIIMARIPRKPPTKPVVTTGIPCNKFLQYCKNMECNPQKYHEQYALLTEKAKEISAEKTNSIATLLENKRKNRYTNISPYDDTRVELRIDEDDEIGSDYINASFIKGYSGRVEYIATQGPMPTTTRDFWKMVLQENVTLIVMVSQFVENDKEKCHRYFPKNHESMTISDDMEVRCSTELHFGTYCVRNLQVRKDDLQATVTHMQFLDWPDFGVPVGTDHVLQFCYQLRERNKVEGGLIVVHCSAGVGRTGTLIATDILLQTANAGKAIDVFNTVLELRKQRVMMVQTDKQYVFIHNMLKEHLDRPPTPDPMENSEPMYENMEIIKHSRESEIYMNKKQDESEF